MAIKNKIGDQEKYKKNLAADPVTQNHSSRCQFSQVDIACASQKNRAMFNPNLKRELKKWEKHGKESDTQKPGKLVLGSQAKKVSRPPKVGGNPVSSVLGGGIRWKPVNRGAQKMFWKSSWICQPPPDPEPKPEKEPEKKPKPKKRKYMSKEARMTPGTQLSPGIKKDFVSETGIRMQAGPNGELQMNMDDVKRVICDEISRLPQHSAGPAVRAAEDARKIMDELLDGIGAKMERFKSDAKLYINDIRQIRFAVVSEVGKISSELGDVRNFLMGPDHDEQVKRLTEFVNLCERLQALKDNGFLDRVTDTMLRLNP